MIGDRPLEDVDEPGPVAMIVVPSYASSLSDEFQILFGAGAILAAVTSTKAVHLPWDKWARESAWRRESTTRARAAQLGTTSSP